MLSHHSCLASPPHAFASVKNPAQWHLIDLPGVWVQPPEASVLQLRQAIQNTNSCYYCKKFEVLKAVEMLTVFWVATPCEFVGGYQHFGETHCHLQGWSSLGQMLMYLLLAHTPALKMGQCVPSKRYLPTNPQGVTTQTTTIDSSNSAFI